jgi:hypothetical protein
MITTTENPANIWADAHAFLEMALDAVEERGNWIESFGKLLYLATRTFNAPRERWKNPGSPFAVELHHVLDMALRNDGRARTDRLAWLRVALEAKATYQDAFAQMVSELAAVARALAMEPGWSADTADPIVSLRDGLATFNVRQVKTELRELLREDKYRFQGVDTRGNPTLVRFQRLLDDPLFAGWVLEAPAAVCGAIAKGHPERFTWFTEPATE